MPSPPAPSAPAASPNAPIADVRARSGDEAAHETAARGMFERIAPTYDTLNRLMSAGIDRRWRAQAVRETLRAPAGPVLDLCAGTMDLTAMLASAQRAPRGGKGAADRHDRREHDEQERDEHDHDKIVALDFSPRMLEAGRHKAPQAEIVVGDAMNLPFADGTFGAIACGFGVRNFADPVRGAREALRVLRPGGVFVTLELFRASRPVTRAFHRVYAQVVLPAVGGLVSGDPDAYRYLARSMAGFLTRAEYERALEGVGFVGVRGFDLTLGVASIVCGTKGVSGTRAGRDRDEDRAGTRA
jgi:ubiquinone/menaquinone biosynthesis methyltransferase